MSYVQTACDLMFAQHISGFVDCCQQQVKSLYLSVLLLMKLRLLLQWLWCGRCW